MKDEADIEQEIVAKGKTAPRLTPGLIDAKIHRVDFHVFTGSQLTVCCLTLMNGFNVTGESACASPENFDRAIGEKIAYANAREKIWALEGYLLKEILASEKNERRSTARQDETERELDEPYTKAPDPSDPLRFDD